jgi:hypothetical protein
LEGSIIGEGIVTSRVEWEPEPVAATADEALAAGGKSSFALAEAEDFLQALLGNGPVSSKQVHAEAQEAGITTSTLRRAKCNLRIKPYKDGMEGGWVWAMPKDMLTTEDAHPKNVSTFGTDEHLRPQTLDADMPGSKEMSDDRTDKRERCQA